MKREDYYLRTYAKKTRDALLNEDRFKKVLGIINEIKREGFLLDIGCGNGELTEILREAMDAEQAFGVDISSEAIASASERGIKAYQVDVSASRLPFENNFFDFIFCGELIEHLFDPDFLLEEIHRTLKRWGTLIITTPNLGAWYNRLSLLFGFQPSIAASLRNPEVGKPFRNAFTMKYPRGGSEVHIRHFTKRALVELLKIKGFQIEDVKGAFFGKQPKESAAILKVMYMFDKLFANFPSLATDLVLKAKKV